MLIVTLYGFGPEALPIISMLGIFVDPPATMVNVSGDTVAAMLVTRIVEGKQEFLLHQLKSGRHGKWSEVTRPSTGSVRICVSRIVVSGAVRI